MNEALAARYRNFLARAAELSDLESAVALIGWDQEVLMPEKGVVGRAPVAATLAGLLHEKMTAPALADDLAALERERNELGEQGVAQVRELGRLHRRAKNVPGDLVRAVAETTSKATATWQRARADKDFPSFVPLLEEMIRLKRNVADAIGYQDDPYDALLDEYEPGAKSKDVAKTLEDVREFLIPIVKAIATRPKPKRDFLEGGYDAASQDKLGREMIKVLGFDMTSGRLDTSAHPFTSGIHRGDTRLTTRYKDDLTMGLWGTLHETGHGLYEQNLSGELRRTPIGPACSLGIHESQSRMFENLVGRNRNFWKAYFPRLQQYFPQKLGKVSLEDFYRAINVVQPSYIRTESDEVTYNLHIVLRFEIERELVSGRLAVKDLPEVWNSKFKSFFGLTPPSDDVGVLQDIHWAAGYVGYFPTYCLGNIYASQFYAAATRDIPELEAQISRGDVLTLRDWLIDKVHHLGRTYPADELIRRATGKAPSTDDFKTYIRTKFGELYGL
jgi:carboxypeptidase Taq